MTDSYDVIFIRDWLEFCIAFVSLLCSSFTLYVIYRLKVWNGNLLLISTLTIFQALYDVNFLFGPSDYYETCVLWNFLDLLGGLGTSFTTNVMALSMIYIVVRIRSINIIENFKYFFIFIGIIPLTISILAMFIIVHASRSDDKPYTDCVFNGSPLADALHNIYYWSRLGSIAFNFLAFWYLSYKIQKMGFVQTLFEWGACLIDGRTLSRSNEQEMPEIHTTDHDTSVSASCGMHLSASKSLSHLTLTIPEQQTLAVRIIVARMRFYPLAQAICRSGSAWDEYDNYKHSNNTSSIMASICSPLSGLFYMIIFLIMQPNAWRMAKTIWQECCDLIFGRREDMNNVHPSPDNDSIHLGNQLRLSYIFRMSASLMDDSTLESIINFPNTNVAEWNQHLSALMMAHASMGSFPHTNDSSRPNSTTMNRLHFDPNLMPQERDEEEEIDREKKRDLSPGV